MESLLQIDRIELCDIADPDRLAHRIHALADRIDRAIPVEEIARALDIGEIRSTPLDGCEGVLLTDMVRSRGSILVNSARGLRPARFSIAHELGHFLMEHHVLALDQGFLCSIADMREPHAAMRRARQEAEANRFAIALLAPDYKTAPFLAEQPGIEVIRRMGKALDVSLEAAARTLIEAHDEPLAAIFCKDGRIRYQLRNDRFPWLSREARASISSLSPTARYLGSGQSGISKTIEVAPALWTNREIPELFEQVRIGRDGHSLTLLWATLPEEEAEDL